MVVGECADSGVAAQPAPPVTQPKSAELAEDTACADPSLLSSVVTLASCGDALSHHRSTTAHYELGAETPTASAPTSKVLPVAEHAAQLTNEADQAGAATAAAKASFLEDVPLHGVATGSGCAQALEPCSVSTTNSAVASETGEVPVELVPPVPAAASRGSVSRRKPGARNRHSIRERGSTIIKLRTCRCCADDEAAAFLHSRD
eukprot:TRINITY_DN17160_c0_g1_i1.p1 TRINITY_DN17160_c0_g1~~TRINITY_DN17160_c0_g1_i1.p1  ORF type:complete len:216 (+),score=37.04 TRINITY_DN17160_c0_g1_i1:39-650(+)